MHCYTVLEHRFCCQALFDFRLPAGSRGSSEGQLPGQIEGHSAGLFTRRGPSLIALPVAAIIGFKAGGLEVWTGRAPRTLITTAY